MFEYTRTLFVRSFDHPVIAFPFTVAVVLAIIGAVLEFVMIPALGWPHPLISAFAGTYAVLFATVGLIGYGALYAYKSITILWDRMGPVSQ